MPPNVETHSVLIILGSTIYCSPSMNIYAPGKNTVDTTILSRVLSSAYKAADADCADVTSDEIHAVTLVACGIRK